MKPAPGTRAVATLGDLPRAEAQLVHYLRDWCDGLDGQANVWTDLLRRQGPKRASLTLRAFEDLLGLMLRSARRPLMRHARDCSCVGADEAVFAHFVMTAATSDHEDAMLIATLLVRADVVPIVTSLAQTLGLALLRDQNSSGQVPFDHWSETTQIH